MSNATTGDSSDSSDSSCQESVIESDSKDVIDSSKTSNSRDGSGTANTVRHRGMGTGISEASKRVPIFPFATQGGKQASSYF